MSRLASSIACAVFYSLRLGMCHPPVPGRVGLVFHPPVPGRVGLDGRGGPRLKQHLALLAMLSGVVLGCTPAENKSKPPATGRADAAGAAAAPTPTSQAAAPRADIPVDPEGFVILGKPQALTEQPDADSQANNEQPATNSADTISTDTNSVDLSSPPESSGSSDSVDLSSADSPPISAIGVSSSDNSLTKGNSLREEPAIDASAAPPASEPASASEPAPAPESGLASFDEKHQEIARDWPKPQALLLFTGQQHGYIEPCGCTGLENQKGGLNRRDTLLTQLKSRGWDVVPMDVGNFERRVGRQAEIKFQTSVEALKDMQYRCGTLGVDDLKLSSTHLLALTATEGKTETPFISANAYVLIEEYMPKSKIIEVGGRKIGVTAILGDSFAPELSTSSDVIIAGAAESLRPVVAQLKKAGCDYLVLLAHATLQESQELAKEVPGFDLVVTAGGYPEPQYQLEDVEGSPTKMAQVGAKGMYTVMVGLYPDRDTPVRYQRVALSSQFADSPRMLQRFATYQKQLQSLGLDGLGVRAQALEGDLKYVGSENCGDCHSKAFQVWKDSTHANATESLVKPPNDRSMIPRHFDPECLSCHVTGWNPQNYYPYASGFASLEKTPLLAGMGCENCHGAGSAHVAAESGDVEADQKILEQLRAKMRLPLAEARDQCVRCHDQDNSPDFQHEGAFEEYWHQIAHPGKD